MSASFPLVSCIMPTMRSRSDLAKRALDLFHAQDYPNKEIVVVDEEGLAIGIKRNMACERSRGELIAHWDDDDWHAPNRLSAQVRALREQGARLAGLSRLVFYDERAARAWLFRAVRPGGQPWLAGGTLVYERTLWWEQSFVGVSDGEDTMFVDVARTRGVKTVAIDDPSLYVANIHDGNTTKRVVDSRWAHFDVETVRRWMGVQ